MEARFESTASSLQLWMSEFLATDARRHVHLWRAPLHNVDAPFQDSLRRRASSYNPFTRQLVIRLCAPSLYNGIAAHCTADDGWRSSWHWNAFREQDKVWLTGCGRSGADMLRDSSHSSCGSRCSGEKQYPMPSGENRVKPAPPERTRFARTAEKLSTARSDTRRF